MSQSTCRGGRHGEGGGGQRQVALVAVRVLAGAQGGGHAAEQAAERAQEVPPQRVQLAVLVQRMQPLQRLRCQSTTAMHRRNSALEAAASTSCQLCVRCLQGRGWGRFNLSIDKALLDRRTRISVLTVVSMTGNVVSWKMRESHLPRFRRKLRADKLYRLRVRLLLRWLQPLEGVCVQQFPEQRTPC